MIVGRDRQLAQITARLDLPGLIVLAGPPGIGRTALANSAALRSGRSVATGGGLMLLRDTALLPLMRAVRAALPADDPALAVEAVRARLGSGVLVLDDLQWADAATADLLPDLAGYLPIIACLRTPAPLLEARLQKLRAAAALWIDLEPLPADAARRLAAGASDPEAVVAIAEGNPAVLISLSTAEDSAASMAALVAELPQAERTALAAIGLLGRPAPPGLLGAGAEGLIRSGAAVLTDGLVEPRPRLLADVAAGVLPPDQRTAMHARLARLVTDPGESARQHAAAGEPEPAAQRAELAAAATTNLDARADHLILAAEQAPSPERRITAARAALAAGRAEPVLQLLHGRDDVAAAVVTARAHLLRGDAGAARSTLDNAAAAAESVGPDVRAEYAVCAVEAETARDAGAACTLAEFLLAGSGAQVALLHAAYGRALLAAGRDGWDHALRTALEGCPGPAAELSIAADLVEALRVTLHTVEAAELADDYRRRSAGAYSWETAFHAEALWGHLHADGACEPVGREASLLADRALPRRAQVLLAATIALVHADGGSVPAARRALQAAPEHPLTDWVRAEVAWLDGDATAAAAQLEPLLRQQNPARPLAALTARHCDLQVAAAGLPELAAATVLASGSELPALAGRWHRVLRREEVRCLLSAADDPATLLRAEELAEQAGLVSLLGRVRRGLRRHGITRAVVPVGDSPNLSPREHQTMLLVAEGLSSRRIAERLGLSPNTVETYIRSAMSKLGARTRTEAAVRAGQVRPS